LGRYNYGDLKMATQQLQLVCDSSTLANFKAWAQPISNWFRTAGYIDTGDSGQLNGAGNNGWASVSVVPGSAVFYYEMFKTSDAYTQFFVKVEYGNVTGTNCPSIRLSLGTGSNGSGTLTGYFTSALVCNLTNFTPPSTTTQYECNFCYGAGSMIAVMMWRNGTGNSQQIFAIERSLDSNGNYTNGYVTLFVGGYHVSVPFVQQTLVFGVGAVQLFSGSGTSQGRSGLFTRAVPQAVVTSSTFNGSIGFDTSTPYVGKWDSPCTVIGSAAPTDIAEGVTFTVTLYGNTRTYMPGKIGSFTSAGWGNSAGAVCMRYD
jgi:hypothetical protein